MSRSKLHFPEPTLFENSLTVRIQDINYGGHVGNDRILGFMHEVRLQWFNALGYSSEIGIEKQIGIIVTESIIQYKSEVFYGNKLQVSLSVNDISEVGMEIYYLLYNSTIDKVAAIGKTSVVFLDYDTRKITKIPVGFRSKL